MKIVHKSKKAVAPPPQLAEFIKKLAGASTAEVTQLLSDVDTWKWPRSDLNAWIKVLNRLDSILEGIIKEYELDKLQVKPFTDADKQTVSEIIRFERLLMENSTNRKTYSSYDRLNSLLFTSDLDVLILTLNLLLRPSQQYSAQPAVSHALSLSSNRLQVLAKKWPHIREYGTSLAELVSSKGEAELDRLPSEAREVSMTIYRTENEAKEKAEAPQSSPVFETPRKGVPPVASSSSTGAVNLFISEQEVLAKPPMQVLADVLEKCPMPDDSKYEVLCRIRTARALSKENRSEREKLVIARLLAIAIYSHTHPEAQAASTLFVYEPDLTHHIAELLQVDNAVPVAVQTAAIAALDALARYRNRMQEVLTAVNAAVNHGILMGAFRKTVNDVANPRSAIPQSFVEALLSFMTFIVSHASGVNMVVGAGLIPLLIQLVENKAHHRLATVSKTMQLLDNVLYSYTNGFHMFCAAQGVDVIVDRIEYEIEYDIELYGTSSESREVAPTAVELPISRIAVLKHILRSMHRMMQSAGTAEGLRNLVNMSLLKSVKKIIEYRRLFGPSILPFAINIMSTFVHNEPTSLTIIQEHHLPETFYNAIEAGIEPAIEVIQAIPNAIGALCLNEIGQTQLARRPSIIPSIFTLFTSEKHLKVLIDKENAVIIGTAIDELIRHHPSLKTPVFEALKSTLGHIEELGNAYTLPADLAHWYHLQPVSPPADVDVSMDVDEKEIQVPKAGSSAPTASSEEEQQDEENPSKNHDNLIVSYIDVLGRFLEGLFQHPPHCKDFIATTDGLARIGTVTSLPCLPYDYANSVASDSMVQIMRTMTEVATSESLQQLAKLVQDSLKETEGYWKAPSSESKLLPLVDVSDPADVEAADRRFRSLVTLQIRITLLSDVFSTYGYTTGRSSAVGLLQTLMGHMTPQTIADLGALHRASIWENIVLNAGLVTKGIIDVGNAAISGDVTPAALEIDNTAREAGANASGSGNGGAGSSSGTANGVQSEASGHRSATAKLDAPSSGPRLQNALAFKHITHGIPNALTPFFQAIVKTCHARRNPDSTHKKQILATCQLVADIMIKHLQLKDMVDADSLKALSPTDETNSLLFTYYTIVIGLFSVLLTEDRTSSIIVHTVALWSFYRAGGFDFYFKNCDIFTSRIGEILAKSEEARSFQEKRELIQAFGGLKVALHLLHPILSAKAMESGQTHLIVTRDKKDTDLDYFELHNFLVRLRVAALPTIHGLWTTQWLIQSPLGVSRAIVRTVLELVGGEGEETRAEPIPMDMGIPTPPTIPRPATGPSEAHVRNLTDMGFPRSAAERALIRTHNNVNAAAELLVAQPFPLPPDPEPEPAPAPAPAEAPAPAAEEVPAAPAEGAPTDEAIITVPTEEMAEDRQQPVAPQEGQEQVLQEAQEPAAEEPSGPQGKSSEEWRTELNEARKPLVDSLSRQALLLIDEHQQLLFDLQKAFTKSSPQQKQAIQNLVDDIKDFSPQAYDVKEQPLANRCRLLALVLCEPPNPLTQQTTNTLMDNLLALLSSITIENPPKWLAAHLLVTEALFTLAEEPRSITLPKEGEPINIEPIAVGPSRAAARSTVFKLCLRLLALEELGSDELLSVLRLFVLFTRNRETANQFIEANGAGLLFQRLKASSVNGGSSYIATILRHLVEDTTTIRNVMQHGIKRYFTQPRTRVVEIGTFVKNCSSIALRDIDAFIESTKSLCQLGQIWTPSPHVSLQPEVAQAPRADNTVPKTDPADMAVDNAPGTGSNHGNSAALPTSSVKLAEAVVHLLLNELMTAVKTINEQATQAALASAQGEASTSASATISEFSFKASGDAENTQSAAEKKEAKAKAETDLHDKYHYVCFIMQCLSELLMSYDACKIAFLAYSPKKKAQTPAKDTAHNRFRAATLQFLLNELVTFGTINPQPDSKLRSKMTICNWAMTVIIALCAESSANVDTKEPSSDLVSVRKYVLESISRTIKELPTSENLDSKYGRLLALADLCNRLLVTRFNAPPTQRKPNAEIPTHVSKIMLEKNYVATLTTSLSEIDLNYPNIRAVVTAILRPLQYLSKVAMKMSRLSAKAKEEEDDEGSITSSSIASDEVEDEDVEREETPDLYRNSALGMYGGEMDDGRFADDEEMGDDDDDDLDDDVEMEYGEETGSEDTENTDEDEDGDDLDDEDEVGNTEDDDDWGEGEEDEEGLIENAEDGANEDDDDEHDEEGDPDMIDDEGHDDEEEMMWEDVEGDGGLEASPDDYDDEDETGVPIQIIHEDEADMGSDEEYMEQGFFNFDSVFNADQIFMNANPRDAGIFVPRRARSHGIIDETSPFFGRSRGGSAPEATVHPLLLNNTSTQRSSTGQGRISRYHGQVHGQRIVATSGPEIIQQLEEVMGPGSRQVLEHLIAQGAAGVFPDGFRLEVPGATFVNISRTGGFPGRRPLSASIRVERAPRPGSQRHSRDFEPLPTVQRWIEETKILHGDFVNERVGKLVNHVALALLPAAIEAAQEAKKREEEAARAAEERAKKDKEEEEERKQEEGAKKDKEGSEADVEAAGASTEKMETEPAPALQEVTQTPVPHAEVPAITTSEQPEQADQEMTESTPVEEPQDAEMADPDDPSQAQPALPPAAQAEASTSQTEASASTAPPERERVTVMIHGSEVDITDTGIDPDFLLALPDDMREEVLNQHVRDQRAARVERPADSQISSEFLDALPPDIRAEILQQEAIERERRRAEEVAAAAPVRAPEEIDPASFIASLDPALRQAVLMEQDDGFIASLPAHMVAEVEGYREGSPTGGAAPRRRLATVSATRGLPPGMSRGVARGAPADAGKTRPQHDAIQLLDKAGIATLIRLLFFPQVLKKTLLFKVLVNLCENSKTRTDLFNLLLSILQDGTGDLATVDKSFAQMSVKGTKPPQTPKSVGKQKLGHEYFSALPLPVTQIEAIPDLIAQKCLDALNFIVTSNELASLFFLTEHELPAGLRRSSSKKGKGKEKLVPQSHYPIVLLLGLLDRQSLLRTPAIMESVVGLLATVTRPLTSLKEAKAPASILGPSIAGGQIPAEGSASAAASEAGPPPATATGTTPAVQAAPALSAESTTEAATSTPSDSQPPAAAAPESGSRIESVEEKVLLANPPQIPHAVLRLIVNILTIGECSGRTFQQSLALIQHLSCIPDARDVIAQELKAKAQEFGHILITDLEELAKTLHDGNEPAMTSTIATKFSPASSTQAKLLRVLKTIDYMYTPRSSTSKDKEKDKNKDIDKVQTIYESFRFSTLWKKLGSCLEVIGEKPDTEHISTVLLPLIESLMVVCKYVGSTASSAIAARVLRGSSSPRSPTSSKESMEELFISFTDAHRKVLNLMVRNNPSLMSGSFSLLVNNPRVLDFDNKRNYFNQQLHRRPHMREHHSTLQLSVRRSRVFEDSFQYLQRKTGDQIKHGKLNVRFYDEEGVDAGGVTREWFQILARQMFDPNNALFQPCAADKLTYQPNKNSWVNPEHLSFFKFVGRVIGKAIYDGRLLDAYFARSLYRQLLGKPVDYKDVEWVDPEYYKSLCWILDNDPTLLDLTFSVEADEFGVNRVIPLKEGGETIPVTNENKREFVQLSASYRLYSSIKDQIESLLSGFYEVIPKELITIFNEQELELLISGTPDIDVDEWRAATEYVGYSSTDPNIVWWWRALKSCNRDERAKVLSFATGTSKVPLNGFTELQGVQGVQRFSIHRAYGENDRLPQAHTCFNQIDLPQYSSYEMLRQQLLLAINEGGEGFAFS